VATYAEALGEPGPDTRLPAWRDAPVTPEEIGEAVRADIAAATDDTVRGDAAAAELASNGAASPVNGDATPTNGHHPDVTLDGDGVGDADPGSGPGSGSDSTSGSAPEGE
jgi:glucosyl-3-phosphoglycerate synthase